MLSNTQTYINLMHAHLEYAEAQLEHGPDAAVGRFASTDAQVHFEAARAYAAAAEPVDRTGAANTAITAEMRARYANPRSSAAPVRTPWLEEKPQAGWRGSRE